MLKFKSNRVSRLHNRQLPRMRPYVDLIIPKNLKWKIRPVTDLDNRVSVFHEGRLNDNALEHPGPLGVRRVLHCEPTYIRPDGSGLAGVGYEERFFRPAAMDRLCG